MGRITKENARKMGKKGGHNSKGVTTLAKQLANRKYCKPDCPIYPCPLQPATTKPEFKGLCALKEAPQEVQALITNLFLKGREGAIREYTNNICEMALLAKKAKTMGQKAMFSDRMNKFVDTAYNKIMKSKSEVEIKGEMKTDITINDLKNIMKSVKEVD